MIRDREENMRNKQINFELQDKVKNDIVKRLNPISLSVAIRACVFQMLSMNDEKLLAFIRQGGIMEKKYEK